jgi:hypothetical protein
MPSGPILAFESNHLRKLVVRASAVLVPTKEGHDLPEVGVVGRDWYVVKPGLDMILVPLGEDGAFEHERATAHESRSLQRVSAQQRDGDEQL